MRHAISLKRSRRTRKSRDTEVRAPYPSDQLGEQGAPRRAPNAIQVGNVTSATLPLSPKDNFQFGVRAVDRDGHHSPVAFPVTNFSN
jgi:hypothetical protein